MTLIGTSSLKKSTKAIWLMARKMIATSCIFRMASSILKTCSLPRKTENKFTYIVTLQINPKTEL